ncbi:MAG: hypothetical protein AAGD35_06700 [Actinomycetota bacterium]
MALAIHEFPVVGDASRLLVLLHDHHCSDRSPSAIARAIDPDGRFRIVSLHASAGNERLVGRCSYERSVDASPDPERLSAQAAAFNRTVEQLAGHHGLAVGASIFAGFCHGAGLAVTAAFCRPPCERPSAVAMLSGALPQIECVEAGLRTGPWPKMLIQHGSLDPLVDVSEARISGELLTEHGLDVTFAEYPIGHEMTEESMVDLGRWLATVA